MIEKKAFKSAVGSSLVAHGYQKRGQTWYKIGDEIVAAVELQKSQYSDLYYVNVAFALRALSGEELLPTHQSHIRLRVERLLPDDLDNIDAICRLDNADLTREEQTSAINEFFSERLVPRCDQLLKIEDIRSEFRKGGFSNAAVLKVAARFLECDPNNP